MTADTSRLADLIASLGAEHPRIRFHRPESPDYEDLRKTYTATKAQPAVIARPQTAEDVQALVRGCTTNGIDFSVRTGGHHPAGLTLVDKAMTIDMRDIDYVHIGEDKKTAKVGGGVLSGALAKELNKHGLVTPCGAVDSIGYVGWSTLGGYGAFSTLYGLGVDQIITAKLVTGKGDLIEADEDLMEGIRGAGPAFGAIVEATVKLYALNETKLLVGMVIFPPTDLKATWTALTKGLTETQLPDALGVQLLAMDFPGLGKAPGGVVTWASDDHDEGRRWIDKVASWGSAVVTQVQAKSFAQYGEDNAKIAPYGVHGASYTLSVREWTPQTLELLAKYNESIPGGGAMISTHTLRSPKIRVRSVFGGREPHHVIEVIAISMDPEKQAEAAEWGQSLMRELRERDSENVLDSAYIALLGAEKINLEKIYGKHYATLVALKAKYDPGNVFKNTVPRLHT